MLTLTDNAQAAVRRFIRGSEEPTTGLRNRGTGRINHSDRLVAEATHVGLFG